jgi:hypothetical protein
MCSVFGMARGELQKSATPDQFEGLRNIALHTRDIAKPR